MTINMSALFGALVQQGKVSKANLIGCTDKEVALIGRHFGTKLPRAYHDFLAIAGKGAGKLFQGTDIFFPRMLQLQPEANELLEELNNPVRLPVDAKVFCMHQGYEINYFLPDSDDPPVFQFFEGQDAITNPWRSFSDFMIASIESHLGQWDSLD